MKKALSVLLMVCLLASLVAVSALAEAEFVKFTGTAYGYKKAGSGKTSTAVRKGSTGAVLETKGKWMLVMLDQNHNLWFRTKYLKEIGESENTEGITFSSGGYGLGTTYIGEDPSAYKAEYKKVRATGKCNIRKGPGLDEKSIGTFRKGKWMTYLGVRAQDNRGVYWYKVKTSKGEVAWVSSVYTKLEK